jgi:hypothetical protein
MNDFSDLENELKKLRPARPSPSLFERIEEALGEHCRASVSDAAARTRWNWRRLTETPYKIGFALAAAVVLLLLARINTNQTRQEGEKIAQNSPASETRPLSPVSDDGSGGSTSSNRFVPAGATQVVYNTRDEGLQFARGSEQPLRRLRYQTHQTWQWRNPTTGASLRVSYPSEEVVLIPVSGQ